MKKNKDLDKLISNLDFIDVSINATHLDYINNNSVLYTVDAAKNGANSWVKPYNKPQLLHHDTHSDAVGRIMSYSIEDKASESGEPENYIKLNVRISDKDAISK